MADTPGETNVPIKEWTTGTLKVYHDAIIGYERQVADERDKRYEERWKAQEKASERYQQVSNEFRGALDDLSTKMATKIEVTTAVKSISEKIDVLRQDLTNTNSRLDKNPEVRALQGQEATRSGMQAGSDLTVGKLYAALAAFAAVVGLVVGVL